MPGFSFTHSKIKNELGDAVAEWSKALLRVEKINENQKILGSPPGPGNLLKKKTKMALSERNIIE